MHFARFVAMSKHDGASEQAAQAARPMNSETFCEIDLTNVPLSKSIMEAFMEWKFKHLAKEERRTAVGESLAEAEHQLKEQLKSVKLLEEKIRILTSFLSDA